MEENGFLIFSFKQGYIMSGAYYLAFDFGAESGRAIAGSIRHNKLILEEIHRFRNRQIEGAGHIHWDFSYLLDELKKGIRLAVKKGYKNLRGIGIDTWGVDYGLLDGKGNLLENPYAYRDSRTDGMMEIAFELIPRDELYSITGIQFMQINSVFQLFSEAASGKGNLKDCKNLLFMPDLFNFFMTGEKLSEYTIASTSQLLNAVTKEWEPVIFEKLGLPLQIMSPLIQPGNVIGKLEENIAEDTGVRDAEVIAVGSHDTASAIAAVPAESPNWAYLSSGTWSLVGIEIDEPVINEDSLHNNFTNEGGVNGKIRFLRNTMGLWILQRCLHSWRKKIKSLNYNDLSEMAEGSPPFISIIDPDNIRFLNPPDMPLAIQAYCSDTGQPVPEKKGEIVRCILESLALKYRFIIDKINTMHSPPVETLHIVGGGSKNELLNRFSSCATGLPVIAGPSEATALGNILTQAITKKELSGYKEGRRMTGASFPLKYYEPENKERWNEVYHTMKSMFLNHAEV